MRSSMLWLYELDANQTHFNLPQGAENTPKPFQAGACLKNDFVWLPAEIIVDVIPLLGIDTARKS